MSKGRKTRARNTQRQAPKAKGPASTATPVKGAGAAGKASGNGKPQQGSGAVASEATVPELIADIADAVGKLPEEQATAPVAHAPDTVSAGELRAAWEDAKRLRKTAEERQAEAERERNALAEEASKLDSDRDALERAKAALSAERETEDERAKEREAEQEELDKRAKELETKQQELDERERELAQDRRALQHEQNALEGARELLEDERSLLDERIDQRVAARKESYTAKLKALEESLAQARVDRDRNEELLRAAEEGTRAIGGRSAAEVLAELDRLRDDRRALQDELENRPPAEQVGRAEALARQNEALQHELATVLRLREDADTELDRLRTEIVRQKLASEHAEALQGAIAGYQAVLAEEKENFKHLVDQQHRGRLPFERMSAMDGDPELAEEPQLARPDGLAAFVTDLRARIAAKPLESGERLYYAEHDLRIFLAGLASSQLQILQGLSGTGKTSLPLAIAQAIGGGVTVVEVQAGWRDRQDLIGHFNTFERRYDETPFVQALYEAQCPYYRDRPYFVVLDEMNLSHPEQYFTSLLSAITREEQKIALVNARQPNAPRLLEEGRILAIPPNVWFIGTANHDETTKEFADKTHDRAHVQELSRKPAPFAPGPLEPQDPVSLAALTELFDDAAREHAQAAQDARAYLDEELEGLFAKRFKVAWGNRLEPQIKRFIPVLLAAGGDLGEGVDHLLATKILRKVRGRHDIRPKDLDELEDRLLESWQRLGEVSEPAASLEILEHEKQRLGGGID